MKLKKTNKPNSLKQMARDSIKLDDTQSNEELAKKMINPYYFTDRNLKAGFKVDSDTHHVNHDNFKLTITPNYPEFGIEVRHFNKIIKEFFVVYARLINQDKFRYRTVFTASFDEQDEDSQVLDETELFNYLKINHKLTETDLDKIDVKSPLEHQRQQQEMKDSGWRFGKNNSMTVYFFQSW